MSETMETPNISVQEARRAELEADGTPFHPESYSGTSPIKVSKLGHMVYEVTDVERTVKFWTEVMGFIETDRNDHGMVFFRCGADHHAIGLKPAKPGVTRRPKSNEAMRMEHLAFEVENTDALLVAKDYLIANDIPIVFEGRKGAGCNYSLHFCDPDGFEFELYCLMDQIGEDGRLRPEDQFRRAPTLADAIATPLPKTC